MGAVIALVLGWLGALFVWAGVAEACLGNGTGPGGCEAGTAERVGVVAWGLDGVVGAVAILYAGFLGIQWVLTQKPVPRAPWAVATGGALLLVWLLVWFVTSWAI